MRGRMSRVATSLTRFVGSHGHRRPTSSQQSSAKSSSTSAASQAPSCAQPAVAPCRCLLGRTVRYRHLAKVEFSHEDGLKVLTSYTNTMLLLLLLHKTALLLYLGCYLVYLFRRNQTSIYNLTSGVSQTRS